MVQIIDSFKEGWDKGYAFATQQCVEGHWFAGAIMMVALAAIVVVWITARYYSAKHWLMVEHGYEQVSLPGIAGPYWAKKNDRDARPPVVP